MQLVFSDVAQIFYRFFKGLPDFKTRFERDTDLALAYREERYNPPSLSKDIRYTVHTTGNSSKSKTLLLE